MAMRRTMRSRRVRRGHPLELLTPESESNMAANATQIAIAGHVFHIQWSDEALQDCRRTRWHMNSPLLDLQPTAPTDGFDRQVIAHALGLLFQPDPATTSREPLTRALSAPLPLPLPRYAPELSTRNCSTPLPCYFPELRHFPEPPTRKRSASPQSGPRSPRESRATQLRRPASHTPVQ